MTSRRHEGIVAQWLTKADHDLVTVRRMSEVPDAPPTDVICFHAQQAAEKALKAVLVAHGIEPERTHDVLMLLDSVLRFVPSLDSEAENLTDLNDFAVRVRYPGNLADPPLDVARKAGETATRVYAAAKAHIDSLLRATEEALPAMPDVP